MTNSPADVRWRRIAVVVTSFGYRHAPAPIAEITLDVRRILRDPHTSAQLRELTGLDPRVRVKVADTAGTRRLVATTATQVTQLLEDTGNPTADRVDVAVGCAGGRHRSVVIAELLAARLVAAGIGVEIAHRDLHQPVLPPS
jgi:UPF0042 nucleotide-binding protein